MTDLNPSLRPDTKAWIADSDAPAKQVVNLGLMAPADAASQIVAATPGFAQPYGLTLNLRRQRSWSSLRDKLVEGELDAERGLHELIYAVHLGIGGSAPKNMAVLTELGQNSQSISLPRELKAVGVTDPDTLSRCAHQSGAARTAPHPKPCTGRQPCFAFS
ncbi:ABC transporter substrate-binding protein [Stutzerimonas stutzeri]|uniref:ABC transporter substrate-binding protein n=1 Tax=Stutzerimonas stutzeri TaxID=316 RepID=UPI0009B662C5